MAGTTVATWVKVKTKTGMTSRPISHKYEGGSGYEPGQVITMSEFQKLKAEGNQKRSDGKTGGSAKAIAPQSEKGTLTILGIGGKATGEKLPSWTEAYREKNKAANSKQSKQTEKPRQRIKRDTVQTSNSDKFRNAEFNIKTKDGMTSVKGKVNGDIGIHKTSRSSIAITHVPSGMRFFELDNQTKKPDGGKFGSMAEMRKAAEEMARNLNKVDGIGKADSIKNYATIVSSRDVMEKTVQMSRY